jgi:hypothetical protein
MASYQGVSTNYVMPKNIFIVEIQNFLVRKLLEMNHLLRVRKYGKSINLNF